MNWFGARTLFRVSVGNGEARITATEQRVVLIRASSFDEAIENAIAEAIEYGNSSWVNSHGEIVKQDYLEVCDVFSIDSSELVSGVEVYSSIQLEAAEGCNSDFILRHFGPDLDEQSSLTLERLEPDFEQSRPTFVF